MASNLLLIAVEVLVEMTTFFHLLRVRRWMVRPATGFVVVVIAATELAGATGSIGGAGNGSGASSAALG